MLGVKAVPTVQQAHRAAITSEACQKAEAVLLRQYSSIFPEYFDNPLVLWGVFVQKHLSSF